MTYYDFEFEVLQKLHNELHVDTISIDRESTDAIQKRRAKDGKLYDVVLYKYYGTKSITLNFKHDFHYKVSEAWLRTSFESNLDASYIASVIIDDVCEEFINKVIMK